MVKSWIGYFLRSGKFCGSCGDAADGFQHLGARVSLLKIGRATGGFGFSAGGGIIMSSDEDERGRCPMANEPLGQVNAGHATELDVQHEAVEPRLFYVREKCLCRRIGDRMQAGRPQQPSKGLTHLFIIIDDGNISLGCAAHRKVASSVKPGVKDRLLSFREGSLI